jgi:hypothetical protein
MASAAFLQSCSDANDSMTVVLGGVGLPDTTHCNETKRTHSIRTPNLALARGREKSEEAASRGLKVAAGTGRIGLAILLFFRA